MSIIHSSGFTPFDAEPKFDKLAFPLTAFEEKTKESAYGWLHDTALEYPKTITALSPLLATTLCLGSILLSTTMQIISTVKDIFKALTHLTLFLFSKEHHFKDAMIYILKGISRPLFFLPIEWASALFHFPINVINFAKSPENQALTLQMKHHSDALFMGINYANGPDPDFSKAMICYETAAKKGGGSCSNSASSPCWPPSSDG